MARLLVHRDGAELAVFANEADRLGAEELPPGIGVHRVPWHGSLADPTPWPAGAPVWRILSEDDAGTDLRAARASLLPSEQERYRALCAETAAALTDVLSAATPQTSERQLAAALGSRILDAGADPLVLLVSGDSGVAHRHPLPTDARLGLRAMAVACARRQGLIANVTRWVAFGRPQPGEELSDTAILNVEADLFAALTPEAPLAPVLRVIQESYPRHGFAADEWTRHHQGGAAGYAGRDPRLAPGIPDRIQTGQAFAWNPTAPGAKVEDTVLLTASGVEVLSVDPRWPTVQVAGRARPAVLRR
ncbi:MAG TPA: M24 family metallopeptidase [Arthrobacter sp.]|nr:M24 family metallopeptidase [Arthrobacter sp.]